MHCHYASDDRNDDDNEDLKSNNNINGDAGIDNAKIYHDNIKNSNYTSDDGHYNIH